MADISASRWRSKDSVAWYQGSTVASVAAANASENAAGSSGPVRRSVSRSAWACSIPMDAPRPSEGLVQAQASATATTPVATGTPSGWRSRWRSSILAMVTMRSSIGSPSSQWATVGSARTVRSQRATSFRPRRARSPDRATRVTDQVPLSAGSMRADMEP